MTQPFTSVLVPLAFGLMACRTIPDLDDRFDENVVLTAYDDEADFTSFGSFAMTPINAVRISLDGGLRPAELDPNVATELTQAVVGQLQARGYGQVEREQAPELGVGIAVVQGIASSNVSNDYWNGSYSSYWGYPGAGSYYPYSFRYTYRTGTLAITLIDLKAARVHAQSDASPESSARLAVIWTSLAYQAFAPGDATESDDAVKAIEQAFLQSPYLQR